MNYLRFPDKEVGQYPMAYINRKAGSNLSESAVMDFIAKQVSLKLITHLPLNSTYFM